MSVSLSVMDLSPDHWGLEVTLGQGHPFRSYPRCRSGIHQTLCVLGWYK